MARLLLVPQPRLDESLSGYVLRLATENEYDTLRIIYNIAGIKANNYINFNIAREDGMYIKELAEITGLTPFMLQEMTFTTASRYENPNHCNFFNGLVPRFAIHSKTSKLCPVCLTEAAYCRKAWDLVAITTCPLHQCILIDRCPRCFRKVSWSRANVVICRCGFDFREISVTSVSVEDTTLTRLIYNLAGLASLDEETIREYGPLFELNLAEIAAALFFVAGQIMRIADSSGRIIGSISDNSRIHSLLGCSLELFADWPQRFHGLLSYISSKDHNVQRDTGVHKDFGLLYDTLYKRLNTPQFDFLRYQFEQFLTKRWTGGYISKLGFSIKVQNPSHISKNKACKALGVSGGGVDKLVADGQLESKVKTMGTRTMKMIAVESIISYKEKREETVGLNEAGVMLGIGHDAVKDLVYYQCLEALHQPARGDNYWRINKSSIVALINTMNSRITPRTGSTLTFVQVIRKVTPLGCCIGRFVSMIMQGAISPGEKNEAAGLKAYLFIEKDVLALTQTELVKAHADFLTMEQSAHLLGVKPQVISFFISKGFIKTSEEKNKRKLISIHELNHFQQNYVTGKSLATIAGVSSKKLIQELCERHIYPISGPQIDGGRQYLYAKSEELSLYQKHY